MRSISSPDYQYPPSKNIYWQKLQSLQNQIYLDHDTEKYCGQWRQNFPDKNRFPTDRKLHVEIGCNAGHVVTEWAAQNLTNAYIGIDYKSKAIYKAMVKLQKKALQNLIFLRSQALRLKYIFAENEIDFLYLFFPDPWPKKSQQKKRTVSSDWIQSITPLVKPGGLFHIKTDHPDYFHQIEETLSTSLNEWEIQEHNTHLYQNHPAPETLEIPDVTLFERIFIREGKQIQSMKLQKKTSHGM